MTSLKKLLLRKSTDEILMKKIQQGNSPAFEVLYDRYHKRFLNFFYKMFNNEHHAQDLLQELFLILIRKSHTFNCDKKFFSWIYSIAHNMCKDEYNKLEKNKIILENSKSIDFIEHSIDIESKFIRELNLELQKLKPELRELFLLRFQNNLQLNEIASIQNIPVGTVKSRLHKTTKLLAEKLDSFKPEKLKYSARK